MESNQTNQDNRPLRILASHPDTGTLRLIRDSISNLLNIEVDTSPSSEYAFELAVKRHYSLFLFGIDMPNLNGQLLYDMLFTIYPKIHPQAFQALYLLVTRMNLLKAMKSGKMLELKIL